MSFVHIANKNIRQQLSVIGIAAQAMQSVMVEGYVAPKTRTPRLRNVIPSKNWAS